MSKPDPTDPAALHALLDELREAGRAFLRERMDALFAGAPAALREMGTRAQTSDERRRFDEFFPLLHKHRALIVQRFDAEFAALLSGERVSTPQAPPSLELALQGDEQLAEMILISDLVTHVEERCGTQIADVEQRLEVARAHGLRVSPMELKPFALCQAFRRACESIEALAGTRSILYRLFERFVGNELAGFYDGLANALEQQGFTAKPRRGAQRAAAPARAPADANVARALQQMREISGDARVFRPPPAGTPPGEMNDRALSARIMQTLQATASGMVGVAKGLAQRMALAGGVLDNLTADPDVPPELRKAISALRFPVIKAAVADEAFLRSERHPLRRLLEELHTMALAAPIVGEQTTSQVAGLIEAVRAQVDLPPARVAGALDAGSAIGEAEVEGFMKSQQIAQTRRRDATAQRVRSIVDQEIALRVAGARIPEHLATPLMHGFGPMLCIQLSRHGRDGMRWQSAIAKLEQVVDALGAAQRRTDSLEPLRQLLHALGPELVAAGMPVPQLAALNQAIEAAGAFDHAGQPAAPATEAFDKTLKLPRGGAAAPSLETTDSGRRRRRRRVVSEDDSEMTVPVGKFITTRKGGRKELSTLPPPPPLAPFAHGECLRSVLAVGSWFRVASPVDRSTQWLKVSAYYPQQDVAAFATFDGTVALSVPGAKLVEDLVSGRTEPVSPEVAARTALDELRYQVRLRTAPPETAASAR